MNEPLILQFCLTMLAAQFAPGPDMILLLKCAVNHPLRAGLLTVLGIVLGLSIHSAVAALGLGVLLQANPLVFRGLMLVGAIYLLWLAGKLLLSLRSAAPATTAATTTVGTLSDGGAFLQGFLTNITNAKAFLFLTSFIAAGLRDDSGPGRKWLLVGIIIGQALVGWSLFLWLLKRPVLMRQYLRLQMPLNALFGILLLAIALQMMLAITHGSLESPGSP